MDKASVAIAAVLAAVAIGVSLYALGEVKEVRSVAPETRILPKADREAIEARLERIEKRVAAVAPAPETDPAAGVTGAPADLQSLMPGLPAEERLREIIRKTVNEEIDAREKRAAESAAAAPKGKAEAAPAEGRKPPLSQVAAELDLDEAQREAVHQAVLRGQEETIGLLKMPTAGGRVPLEDLMKALLEKPEKQRDNLVEVFGMLATEKVPGSEETYAQRVEGVKKATSEAFRRQFSPEQFKSYEKTGQDPLEIQIADSPWIQVLQEAWKRKP